MEGVGPTCSTVFLEWHMNQISNKYPANATNSLTIHPIVVTISQKKKKEKKKENITNLHVLLEKSGGHQTVFFIIWEL